jgi:hypothetical protein
MKKIAFACILAGLACISSSCGNSKSTPTRFRLVNAAPLTSNVDLLVDTAVVVSNIPYATTSGYKNIKAGSRQIQVRPAGNTTTFLIDTTLTINDRKDTTLVLADFPGLLALPMITDDNTAPATGNAKVRVLHASPSAGLVDVYFTTPGADINSATPTYSNVQFENASSYTELTAGTYQVRFTPAGTKFVLLDSGNVSLVDQQIRTYVLLDSPDGGGPFSVLPLADLN